MKKSFFILFILICRLPVFSQSPFSSRIDSLVLKGFDYTFNTQFDSAMYLYQQITEQYPEHPIGYFYQAATLQSQMLDEESNTYEDLFYEKVDQAIEIGERQLEKDPEDPWLLFFVGSAKSYRGLYQYESGQIVKGFISAKEGLSYFRKTVKMDTSLYDAYLGLGNFKYWSGRYYKYLRFLPWIRDERDLGIEMIETSVNKGTFSYWVGINSLGWIELDRSNYDRALELFKLGLDKYPKSRFYLWGLGSTYLQQGDFIQALITYKKILDSILEDNQNGYNEAECRLHMANCYQALGYDREVILQCDAILKLKVEETIEDRIKEHRKKAKKYKQQSLETLKATSNTTGFTTTKNEPASE